MNTTVKQFTLNDSVTNESLSVKIPQVTDAAYGLYIWPCAPVLAQYVWHNRKKIKDKSILELGAGTALPGIVAAKCGASVILSDNAAYEHCLNLCRQSAELNSLSDVSVLGIAWGQVTPVLVSLPPVDIILASDCFYDSKDFEDIIMTLSYLLHQNPRAEVWCTYQERSSERSVEYFLDKWHLYGEQCEIPSMDTMESEYDDYTRHVIQLFVIKLKDQ